MLGFAPHKRSLPFVAVAGGDLAGLIGALEEFDDAGVDPLEDGQVGGREHGLGDRHVQRARGRASSGAPRPREAVGVVPWEVACPCKPRLRLKGRVGEGRGREVGTAR